MKETVRESLLGILSKEKLLDEEQIRLIKSKEVLQRSKILKSKGKKIVFIYSPYF